MHRRRCCEVFTVRLDVGRHGTIAGAVIAHHFSQLLSPSYSLLADGTTRIFLNHQGVATISPHLFISLFFTFLSTSFFVPLLSRGDALEILEAGWYFLVCLLSYFHSGRAVWSFQALPLQDWSIKKGLFSGDTGRSELCQ